MKKMFAIFAAALAITAAAPTLAIKQQAPRFLYVQNAGSMTLSEGTLTLTNVAPTTLFFSDRPRRIAGQMRTQAFIKHWDKGVNSFKASPSNATVAVFADAANITEAIVEISEPRFDGVNLTYRAKV